MNRQIKDVEIDKLTVDEQNVRGEAWSSDEGLIKSIEEHGVIQPIFIRPIEGIEGKDYGIVAGSRRYHASMEAGLDKMPAVIKKMSNEEALAVSIKENRNREDVPVRRQLAAIKEWFEKTNSDWSVTDKIRQLRTPANQKTDHGFHGFGFTRKTAENYMNVLQLGDKIQKEYGVVSQESSDANGSAAEELPIEKAAIIGRKVKKADRNISEDEQKEIIEAIKDESDEKAVRETIERYIETGDVEKAKRESKIPKRVSLKFNVDNKLKSSVADACMDRSVSRESLLESITEEWLESEGYL